MATFLQSLKLSGLLFSEQKIDMLDTNELSSYCIMLVSYFHGRKELDTSLLVLPADISELTSVNKTSSFTKNVQKVEFCFSVFQIDKVKILSFFLFFSLYVVEHFLD